jgi:hypothetical protein
MPANRARSKENAVTFWKIATSALLALTWSLPAFATQEGRRDERRKSPYDHRIEWLANELAESAGHLDREIRGARHSRHSYTPHHDRYQRRAVQAVHRLKDTAKRFHHMVERDRGSSHDLAKGLRRVAHSYRKAVHQVERMHPHRRVKRDLKAVGTWIGRISERFEPKNRHAAFSDNTRTAHYGRIEYSDGTRPGKRQGSISHESSNVAWERPERYAHH